MTTEPHPPDTPEPAKPIVQFSLRSAFSVMTLAAVGCALVFQVPDVVAVPFALLVTVALVPVLITVMIYGSSYQRTFSIGAISPPALLLASLAFAAIILSPSVLLGANMELYVGKSYWEFRAMIGLLWVSTPLMGFLCMATRRLVEKRPGKRASTAAKASAGPWNADT